MGEQTNEKRRKRGKSNGKNGREEKKNQGKERLARLFGLNITCDQKHQCWNIILKRGTTPLEAEKRRKKGKERERQERKKKRSKGRGCQGIRATQIKEMTRGKQK